MSFESNDERIERLEATVKALVASHVSVCKWAAKFTEGQSRENSGLISFSFQLNKDLLGLKKIILTQPIFGSADIRSKYMAEIEQQELQLDKLIAELKDSDAKLPTPPLLPPWP